MRLVLAAVAALALVAAAGCGGVESEPNLAKAVERTEATSFAVEVRGRITEAGETIELGCEGSFDPVHGRARLTCAGSAGYDMVTVDGANYTRSASDEKWWKAPADSEDPFEQFSPEHILGLLRSASRKTERVGDEDVRGEPTVRYALTVDCEQAEIVDCSGETTVVDVWIDGEGLVRRIHVEDGAYTVEIEFFDFGAPVFIQAPPPDLVETPSPLETLPVDPPRPCKPDEAAPIGVNQALDALRRNGFELGRDEQGCSTGLAGELTSRGEADFRDGHLMCSVLTAPGAITAVSGVLLAPGSSNRIPEPLNRTIENVECTLFVEGSRANERIDALDAALDELKRELGG